jgi:hypothetical protein
MCDAYPVCTPALIDARRKAINSAAGIPFANRVRDGDADLILENRNPIVIVSGNFFGRKYISANVESREVGILFGQELQLHLSSNLELSLQTFLLDKLLVKPDLFDNDRDLGRQHLKDNEIVLGVRIQLIALEIKNTDHLLVRNDRCDHLGPGAAASCEVPRIFADIRRDDRLPGFRDATQKALAQFQTRLDQFKLISYPRIAFDLKM